MKILVAMMVLAAMLFSQEPTISDLKKYEQYKSLLDNKNLQQQAAPTEIKMQEVANIIQENNSSIEDLKVKETQEKNLFKYKYEDKDLKRYGENFFSNKNVVNPTLVPSSGKYILNVGDTIFISTYETKENQTHELKIDNNGNINIPNLGLLKVASLNLQEAKTIISNFIVKSFPNTKVIVDISGYSAIQVVVTGNVKTPGIYNLSSFSTIKDALITANGLLDVGSYRDIEVVRGGKVVHKFDLYQLLHDATQMNDALLKNSDIVTVKFTQKSIYLKGKVKQPAIYELKNSENFSDLMKYSGGFSFDATKDSIKLTRYDQDKKLKTYIMNQHEFYAMKPQDGDSIEVFNNLEIKEQPYIYVYGKVVNGDHKYKYFDGIKLKELHDMVTFRSEIVQENRETLFVDKDKIKITRNNNDEKRTFLVALKDDFVLQAFDEVEFFNYFDTHPRMSATIKGEVYSAGTYFIDPDTTLKQFIELTGGFTKKAHKQEVEIARYKVVNNQREREIVKVSFDEALSDTFTLQDGDEINIFTIPSWNESKTITIKGEVKFPGIYSIETGEKLSSVIQRAGGYTASSFIDGAVFTRNSIRMNEEKRVNEAITKLKQEAASASANTEAGKDTSTTDLLSAINLLDAQAKEYKALGRLTVYLDKDLEKFKTSQFDIRLEDKDTLIIPALNDTVSVYGEVMNPTSFVFNDALDAHDYIKKAGDLTQRADEDSIYMILANGEASKLSSGYLFSSSSKDIGRGATIVVPMKINAVSNIVLWKEVSQVAYQIAFTLASLNAIGAF